MQGLYSAAGLAAGVGLFLFGMGQLTGGLQQTRSYFCVYLFIVMADTSLRAR